MSANPLRIGRVSQPAPAGVKWIDLQTASSRSGMSVGHLSRICGDRWMSEGLARMEPPPGGGKARWEVREDADQRMLPVKFADQLSIDFKGLSEKQRRQLMERREILRGWEIRRKAGLAQGKRPAEIAAAYVAELAAREKPVKLSVRSLYRLEEFYRTDGMEGLLDDRTRRAVEGEARSDDPYLLEVQRLYLSTKKRALKFCHELAEHKAAEQGWKLHSYKTAQRFIAKLPAAVVYKFRGGEEAFVNHAEPYLERDYSTIASNELWNADHHRFDVMVKHEGRHIRPWLTAFQDVRSRKIVGWCVYAQDPNSDVIITALRQSLLDCGAPTDLMVDNGKDFDCKILNGQTKKERRQRRWIELLDQSKVEGLFQELRINVGHCWVYHGQSKPIERWFGFVESRTTVWDTYCGGKAENKPEDLEKHLAAGHAPTLSEFAAWFDEWVTHYNAGHHHSGDSMNGKTPDAVWAENLQSKRVVSRELLDVLCLKRIGPVKVQQNGVMYQGLRYGQFEPALTRLLGKAVCLRVDERDIRQVQIYEAGTDKFICVAACNARLPMKADAALLRGAISEKKGDRRALKQYFSTRPRMVDDLPDRMLRHAAARAAAAKAENPTPAPPSMQPVRHPLEECLPAVAQAMERRKPLKRAVGAEGMGDIDLLSAATMAHLEESERARKRDNGDDSFDLLTEAMAPRSGGFKYESPNDPELAEPLQPTTFGALMAWRARKEAEERSDDE